MPELMVHTATIETGELSPSQKEILAIYLFDIYDWRARFADLRYRMTRARAMTPEAELAFSWDGVLQLFVVGSKTHFSAESALADDRQFDLVVRSSCLDLAHRLIDDLQKDLQAVIDGDETLFTRPTRQVEIPRGWKFRDPDGEFPLSDETVDRLIMDAMTPRQKAWVRRNPDKPWPFRIIYEMFAPRTYAIIGMNLPSVQRLVLRMREIFAAKKRTKNKVATPRSVTTYRERSKARYAGSIANSLATSVRR